LNDTERGRLLGEFDTGDNILLLFKDGTYEVCDVDLSKHFVMNDILYLGKLASSTVITAVHFDGNKEWTMVKRFKVETNKLNERFSYLTDHKKSQMLFVSVKPNPRISYAIKVGSKKMDGGEINLAEFIDVKGWKALGNKLSDQKLLDVKEVIVEEVEQKRVEEPQIEITIEKEEQSSNNGKLQIGDSLELF
jgi:topoisomerase-4 subunit A